MMLEVLIKKSNNGLVKILRNSRIFATINFMVMSGIIMNVLQKGNTDQFWYAETMLLFVNLPTLLNFRLIAASKKLERNEKLLNANKYHAVKLHKFCAHDELSCLNYLKHVR